MSHLIISTAAQQADGHDHRDPFAPCPNPVGVHFVQVAGEPVNAVLHGTLATAAGQHPVHRVEGRITQARPRIDRDHAPPGAAPQHIAWMQISISRVPG